MPSPTQPPDVPPTVDEQLRASRSQPPLSSPALAQRLEEDVSTIVWYSQGIHSPEAELLREAIRRLRAPTTPMPDMPPWVELVNVDRNCHLDVSGAIVSQCGYQPHDLLGTHLPLTDAEYSRIVNAAMGGAW